MHVLALALGKTLGELQEQMTEGEIDSWREFYLRYPFDDLHRFHRPAALVAGAMSGGMEEKLAWLQLFQPPKAGAGKTDADKSVFNALG